MDRARTAATGCLPGGNMSSPKQPTTTRRWTGSAGSVVVGRRHSRSTLREMFLAPVGGNPVPAAPNGVGTSALPARRSGTNCLSQKRDRHLKPREPVPVLVHQRPRPSSNTRDRQALHPMRLHRATVCGIARWAIRLPGGSCSDSRRWRGDPRLVPRLAALFPGTVVPGR